MDGVLIDSMEFNSISIVKREISISFCDNTPSITERIVEVGSKTINFKLYKSSLFI